MRPIDINDLYKWLVDNAKHDIRINLEPNGWFKVSTGQISHTGAYLSDALSQFTVEDGQPKPKSVSPSTIEYINGLAKVPEGYYALPGDIGAEHQAHFYKVEHGKPDTKWEGWIFVNVIAGPEEHPVKNYVTKKRILEDIAKDVKAASLLYGKLIGNCGICGLRLTDETSRARGIGPVCANKMGW